MKNPLYKFRITLISQKILRLCLQGLLILFLEIVRVEMIRFLKQCIHREKKIPQFLVSMLVTALRVLLSVGGHGYVCVLASAMSGHSCNHPVWHTKVLCIKCHVHRNGGEEITIMSSRVTLALCPTFSENVRMHTCT